MIFDIFTLFPEAIEPYIGISILQRAVDKGLLEVRLHDIRDWTYDRHHITDDYPYGGGGGMVMKPEPIFTAVEEILGIPPACPLLMLTPQGRLFNQDMVMELASNSRIALLCGRYEGVDERVRQHLITDEVSIGDYVLTGGELPAMVVLDAVTRLLPGALGDPDGPYDDSHASGLLEYPHYTRPASYRGWDVPEVLLSGNHARIAQWRREQALSRTYDRRPDMLTRADLSKMDKKFLDTLAKNADDIDSKSESEVEEE